MSGLSPLLVRPDTQYGRVLQVTPQSARWSYVGFDLLRLRAGEEAGANPSE